MFAGVVGFLLLLLLGVFVVVVGCFVLLFLGVVVVDVFCCCWVFFVVVVGVLLLLLGVRVQQNAKQL